jgi:hypothetical protein
MEIRVLILAVLLAIATWGLYRLVAGLKEPS